MLSLKFKKNFNYQNEDRVKTISFINNLGLRAEYKGNNLYVNNKFFTSQDRLTSEQKLSLINRGKSQ